MTRSPRILLGLAALLALLFTFSGGSGAVPSAGAAKPTPVPTPTPAPTLRAGIRASDYGISPFPSPTWWISSIQSMASRFPGSVGEQIAIPVEVFWRGWKDQVLGALPATRDRNVAQRRVG